MANKRDNSLGGLKYNRRTFLTQAGGIATATIGIALAGCTGGGNEEGIRIPGIYDLSGATADVGRPTGIGSRDTMEWLNENGDLDEDLIHDSQDYAYEVPEAQQQYDSHTQGDNPPVIIGWGTADTEALANEVAADEIVYISASYSDDLMSEETPYNFFTNLDYTTQCRVHLEWIAQEDSNATVVIIHPPNPFGNTVLEGAEAYAQELEIEYAGSISLDVDENDAGTQVQRAESVGADYIIHHNTAAPMQVLLSAASGTDIEVLGTTWTTDELRTTEATNLFEGVRYVNANMTFAQAMNSEADGWEMIETNFERKDHDMDNPEVANLNYIRGVSHALLAYEGVLKAQEMGNDPNSGADVREAIFELEDFDAWGLISTPMNYEDGDRRPTMTGQLYEVEDGEIVPDGSIELERREEWIPPYDF